MTQSVPDVVYKIISKEIWGRFDAERNVPNMEIDGEDGFVHLSTAAQLAETLSLYFGGQNDVEIVAISTSKIASGLKWEASRGGALFPHYYGEIAGEAVIWHQTINVPSAGAVALPDRVT